MENNEAKNKICYRELKAFDDMKTILQYLYLGNTLTVTNEIGVSLELSVSDSGILCQKNLNYPQYGRSPWSENMTIENAMGIVEQLSERPAMLKMNFSNMWEEIKAIVELNLLQAATEDRGFPTTREKCPTNPTEIQLDLTDVINVSDSQRYKEERHR